MLDILKLIRPAKSDAAGLRTKIAEIDQSMIGLNGLVRHAERKRSEALLTKSDREVEALEKDLALAIRNRDRAVAARELMEKRAAEAEAAEARAALDAARDAAEKRASAIAKRLRPEYEAASLKLIPLLTELGAAEIEVSDVNQRLHEAGRSDEALSSVETRVIDHGRNHEIVASLTAATALRPIGASPGWGKAAEQASYLGFPTGLPQREA